jgi:hypothetical protein
MNESNGKVLRKILALPHENSEIVASLYRLEPHVVSPGAPLQLHLTPRRLGYQFWNNKQYLQLKQVVVTSLRRHLLHPYRITLSSAPIAGPIHTSAGFRTTLPELK